MNNKLLILAVIAAAVALLLVGLPQRTTGPSCPGGGEITPIHTIQGAGARSPLVGNTVTVSAVVAGALQGKDHLHGSFPPEADQIADYDPATS
ncbi:endonuclease, partial [Candidatus Acetothermia bacterium]